MAFSALVNFAAFWFFLFSCGNPKYFAERTLHQQCISWDTTQAIIYLYTITNIAFDFTLMLLPIPGILEMKRLTPIEKLSVVSLFALAGR